MGFWGRLLEKWNWMVSIKKSNALSMWAQEAFLQQLCWCKACHENRIISCGPFSYYDLHAKANPASPFSCWPKIMFIKQETWGPTFVKYLLFFLLFSLRICDPKRMEDICLHKRDKLWSTYISWPFILQPMEMAGKLFVVDKVRTTSLWKNATSFSNVCQMQDKSLESQNYLFIFGGGARQCPGKELGIAEISTFLHYFVTRYR